MEFNLFDDPDASENPTELAPLDSETDDGKAHAVFVQDFPSLLSYAYVGRKHPRFPGYNGLWGNPFVPQGRHYGFGTVPVPTIEYAVNAYSNWLKGVAWQAVEPARRQEILRRLPELKGRRLACWRHPGPCHAQVLAEMVNALPFSPAEPNHVSGPYVHEGEESGYRKTDWQENQS